MLHDKIIPRLWSTRAYGHAMKLTTASQGLINDEIKATER